MTWTDRYRERMNAENLARQHPNVQAKHKEILNALHNIESYLNWALDPEEVDHDYDARNLIENAHALLDLAHEYRAELRLNPPPKVEWKDESSLTNPR